MPRTRPSLILLSVMLTVPAGHALSQGRGEGGIVNRDGVTIYVSSKGTRAEVQNVPRGFGVAGVTTMGLSNTFQFEEENGRVHVMYLKLNDNNEQKSLQRNAWMDPADLDRFTYECSCEAGAEAGHKCSPLAVSGMVSRSWNACFKEGYAKKMAELKARGEPTSNAGNASVVSPSPRSSQPLPTSSEKPLTNDDVIALAKAGLGDDLVVSKVQQAPREVLDVSIEALIKLKKDGLGKPVIDAMMKRASKRTEQGRELDLAPSAAGAAGASERPVAAQPEKKADPVKIVEGGAYQSPMVLETTFPVADRSLWQDGKRFSTPEWWELGRVSCDGVYLRGDPEKKTGWETGLSMKVRDLPDGNVEVKIGASVQNPKRNRGKIVTLVFDVLNVDQRVASQTVRIKAKDNGDGYGDCVIFSLPSKSLRSDPMTKLRITMTTRDY